MRWADTEAIGLFENIKNQVDVTDNYGRLIWNYTNRGNNWRDREMVGLLTSIRADVDVVDNYGRMIWNYANRTNNAGDRAIYYLLTEIRDGGHLVGLNAILTESGSQLQTEDGNIINV